jgi:hypothetical protein
MLTVFMLWGIVMHINSYITIQPSTSPSGSPKHRLTKQSSMGTCSGLNSPTSGASTATSLAATIAMAELQHEQQLIDMTAQRDTNAALVQDLQEQLQAQAAVIADQNASVIIAQHKTQRFEADNHGLLQKIRNMEIAAEQTVLQHDSLKSKMIEVKQQLQLLETAAQHAKDSPDAILVRTNVLLISYMRMHRWQ